MSVTRQCQSTEELEDVGAMLAGQELLSVRCRRSHHVATMYETAVGPVYRSAFGSPARRRRDRFDTTPDAVEYVELLSDPGADEVLPAWCECGSWTLSRAGLLAEVRAGTRTVQMG